MVKPPPLMRSFLRLLFPYLWKNWKNRLALLLTLCSIVVDVALTLQIPRIFNDLLACYAQPIATTLWSLSMQLFFGWLVWKTIKPLGRIAAFYLVNQAIRDTRKQVILHLHQVPLNTYPKEHIGSISNASMRVSTSLRNFSGLCIENVLPTFLKIVFLGLKACTLHYTVGYFLPAILLLVLLWSYWRMRSFRVLLDHAWQQSDEVMRTTQESLQNTHFIRNRFATEEKHLNKRFAREADAWWRVHINEQLIPWGIGFLFFLGSGGLLFYLAHLLERGEVSKRDLQSLKGSLFLLYRMLVQFATATRRFLRSALGLKRVCALLGLPRDMRFAKETTRQGKPKNVTAAALEAQHLSFYYAKKEPVLLEALSFSIAVGEKVAIIGDSGSGKSTLCNLLAGLLLPTVGDLRIQGRSARTLNPATIGNYLHFVPQRAPLAPRDIEPHLLQEKSLIAHPVVRSLQANLDKGLEKPNLPLSNGEKQQLLLLRCLHSNPQIAILDEAFSDIDDKKSQEFLHSILRTIPTVILVTHRYALIQDFDTIYELSKGQLINIKQKRRASAAYQAMY